MNQSMPYASPRTTVRRQMLLTAVSLAAAGGLLAIPARGAQLVEVDEKPLAEAYRASKLIGASVVNDKNREDRQRRRPHCNPDGSRAVRRHFGRRLPGHQRAPGGCALLESDDR